MEYSGKLYGKVGSQYFPLMETTEDVETLKKRIAELEVETKQLRLGDVVKSLPQDTDACSNDRDKCSCKGWGGCPVD